MPVYSRVEITFLEDFVEDSILSMTLRDPLDVVTSEQWQWVVLRSASNEVTIGTPTANAGETTAINFKAAFDLDNPTGYVTTQIVNRVIIDSETLGQDFVSIRCRLNDVTLTNFSVRFENYVAPPTSGDVEFALVRSPHYVNIPFVFETTTKANIDLYVWSGDLSTPPIEPTVELEKIRPTVDYEEFNVDLSKLISDRLDVKPDLDITIPSTILDSPIDNNKWIRYVASYTDPDETIADITGIFAATDGYGYMLEGANPTKPSNDVLLSTNYQKVDRSKFIMFPFANTGTITGINVTSENLQINENHVITTTADSQEYIKTLCVGTPQVTTDEYITIEVLPSGDTYTYELLDECRYEPTTVVFMNKFGVYTTVTMFKKRTNIMSIESESFKNNYISGGTYDVQRHQKQVLNVIGSENVRLNSGYITEDENEIYKQLLLSDKVFFFENDLFIPVNVLSKNVEFKTRVNDRLVLYTLEFEYAFNTINNI